MYLSKMLLRISENNLMLFFSAFQNKLALKVYFILQITRRKFEEEKTLLIQNL